jgi:hypothetical protein
MTTTKPYTIVQVKQWLQKTVSANARIIDKNDQTRRYNDGETKWKPTKKGNCSWLRVSTDAKRHVLIWTMDASPYMKAEAKNLAKILENIVLEQLGQTVPIEFKDAPTYTVTSTSKSIEIYRGELVTEPADDDCPF